MIEDEVFKTIHGPAVNSAAKRLAGSASAVCYDESMQADIKAAAGAAGGALFGGMRRRDQLRREQQAQQQWAAQETAGYEQNRAAYDRAQAACLEGRGYTVR